MTVIIDPEWIRISGKGSKWLVLRIAELPDLWQWHVDDDPLTAIIERAASRFVRAGCPPERAFLLVRATYAWGGLRGRNPELVTQACRQIGDEQLSRMLSEARTRSCQRDFKGAIETLRPIKGMKVSFHSKILRFLCPDHAAVLDSRIVDECDYPPTSVGYRQFVQDCREVRNHLNAHGVGRGDGRPWRVTDVEMAIFGQIKQNIATKQKQAA